MNNILFKIILVSLGPIISNGSIDEGRDCCFEKEYFNNRPWYKAFLIELTKENRIDNADARMIKSLSSDSHIAFEEPITTTINRHGQIKESDIKLLCEFKEENDSIIYAAVSMGVYYHLFSYSPTNNKLIRIKNTGVIVVSGIEDVKLVSNNDSLMTFREESQNLESWRKYFIFNKKSQTLYHARTCRTFKGKEECRNFYK